jgi:hypothetical protein
MLPRVLTATEPPRRAHARRALPFTVALLALGLRSPPAHADGGIELSGLTGFGVFVAGVTPPRFSMSPGASFSVRGESGFFVVRDTVSFLGAGGGRFGIDNHTTIGGGVFWEAVNLSAGVAFAAYSLPLCGPELCAQVRGVAPGVDLRLDVFGPYLSGAFGVSLDCAVTVIAGAASRVWRGVSGHCLAGPVFRFSPRS